MENMNYANKAAEAEMRKCRYAASKKHHHRPEMNLRAKLDAEVDGNFHATEKVGNLTYADIAAICGTAAAERMSLSRRSRNNEVPAIAGTETAVRRNLARALVKRGVVVTDEMSEAIYGGNYDKLLHEAANAKPYIIDDILQAQNIERAIVDKRESQIVRGASAYSDDKSNAALAGVAYAALVVSSIAAVVKKLAK